MGMHQAGSLLGQRLPADFVAMPADKGLEDVFEPLALLCPNVSRREDSHPEQCTRIAVLGFRMAAYAPLFSWSEIAPDGPFLLVAGTRAVGSPASADPQYSG
jgi:hypothetical protein